MRKALAVGGTLAVGLAAGMCLSRPAAGQQAGAPPAAGPYQAVINPHTAFSTVFVVDTHTGQVWWKNTNAEGAWHDMRAPNR